MIKTADLQLDPWQEEVLNYDGSFILCTGRQVGKTTIMSRKAAEYMIKNKGSRIIVVSLTEDQAKLMIVMILDYLERYHKTYIAKGKDKPTQNKIILTNKSLVIARPVGNTGDAVRGFTGEVLIIDEASRMPELAFTAAKPVLLTTGGQIWMCSTPAGKQGYFWESYNNADLGKSDRFKTWHVTSEKVLQNRKITENWTEEKRIEKLKFLEEERKDMSNLQYGQEYEGLFLDDLQRYFSDDWIERACKLNSHDVPPIFEGASYFLGVDIARLGGDETAFEVLQLTGDDEMMQVYSETETNKLTTWTEDRIIELDKMFKFRKIYIDAGAGSLGVGIFDRLLKCPQTKRKVIAINNRKIIVDRENESKQRLLKEDLYDNLRALGERGKLKLFKNDKVMMSLKSVQYEYNKDEKKQISRMLIFGNYTHITEGLIRAAWAYKEKKLNMHIYWV